MTNALAVVAHYDDHPLFMGATIRRTSQEGWKWFLIAMCVEKHAEKKLSYFNKFCDQLGVERATMQFRDWQTDPMFWDNPPQSMRTDLFNAVAGRRFDWVFTHSREPGGEYDYHGNHAEVEHVVTSMVTKNQLVVDKAHLAYFAYRAISGRTAAFPRFDDVNRTKYLQLTYEELEWKRLWCVETTKFDTSLVNIGNPCPNPEAFEGDGLELPLPFK